MKTLTSGQRFINFGLALLMIDCTLPTTDTKINQLGYITCIRSK
ncbi:hypothetical protein MADA3029_530029 [Vibrio nigripulchritudo MADA3029]|uniref:Uncharacterized protein n=2 Tax=Vibrio nigripulchritudo TaxID=28173 RepID=U4K0B6_9VIBR|nr:hypothetical protein VIBNIAM115_740006 [Vibrio nigripulchritudo AM115]CCN39854.1 hypothetical protein VIBNIFTn2_1140044 [Vibrio nigripulchritudo FTn2]CCN48122.1 hypothetical protein VIBNIMADA3020_570042 [Vibrio nigripulchritudo MADA3020]CCN54963.1 hypothetical protein VIBNIMADA3021_630029 [Vibrio nigripulchritudo MADA3021]CCN60108.1 hypothetical protein MADA3029_530029 [Vibrio nigripulchritudo MADA3029]CCN67465.1 hypothetical protein VIBNIPon4_790004 [Vibrio nigripulchritudo POn4]CCN71643.